MGHIIHVCMSKGKEILITHTLGVYDYYNCVYFIHYILFIITLLLSIIVSCNINDCWNYWYANWTRSNTGTYWWILYHSKIIHTHTYTVLHSVLHSVLHC